MLKLNFSDGDITLPEGKKEAGKFLGDLFLNRGYVDGHDEQLPWEEMYKILSPKHKDMVSTSEIRPLLASAMQTIIREPVDPMMVITNLFTPIQAKGLTTQVLAGAIGGAIYADDIAEGGTAPEAFFNIGGALQTAYIGKSGIQASFTDEALRYSTWDIWNLNMRMMRKALVRHKEAKAAAFLATLGTKLFNNADPTDSLFGVCTGRGLDMAANGSMIADDLFKAVAHMTEEGFAPDVLLVNPQFFYLFLQDPVLRNIMMVTGSGIWQNTWSGNPGPLDPWSNGSLGKLGPSMGNAIVPANAASGETATGIAGREHGMNATFTIPSYFGTSLTIVPAPAIPFDKDELVGDMILGKAGEFGLYLKDQDPTEVSWRDESVDVVKVKLTERYGFGLASEGQGVGVLKSVKLARNYWDGTVKATTMEVISEISSTADVL